MRLIDADALLNELGDIWNIPKDWDGDIDETCETAFDVIENAPTVEVKPVVHGKWEKTRLAGEYICSNCQSLICSGFTRMGYEQYKFCPECGADMRKKVE